MSLYPNMKLFIKKFITEYKLGLLTLLTIFLALPFASADVSVLPNFNNCSIIVSNFESYDGINKNSHRFYINNTDFDCDLTWYGDCWGNYNNEPPIGYSEALFKFNNAFEITLNENPLNLNPMQPIESVFIFNISEIPQNSYINVTLSGGTQASCTINYILNPITPTAPVCSPPKNPRNTWTITDDQVCINRTICRQNSINITSTGSLTLQNTTLQTNLISLYNFWVDGYFVMDINSLLIPPNAPCPYKRNNYVPIIALEEEKVNILPITFITFVLTALLLL